MNEGYKIKAIVKRADEPRGHMTSISCSLKNLQNIVEGYIETVTIGPGLVIICNEEGRLRGLPYNCEVAGITFVGDIICIGAEGDEFADVPISLKEWDEIMTP